MHLLDIQNLLGPSSSIRVVWDEECFPSLTSTKVRPSRVDVLNKEKAKELYRMLESDKVRVKFRRWPQRGCATIEKGGSSFIVTLTSFMTVVVPQPLVDQVFSTGNPGFFENRGYRFKTYREESRHGAKWVKTEVCGCVPGLDPKDAVRYRVQLMGQGKTSDEAFRSAISSTLQEVALVGSS